MTIHRYGDPARPPTVWTGQDLAGTLRALGPWWALMDGGDDSLAAETVRALAPLLPVGAPGPAEIGPLATAVAAAGHPVDRLGPVVDLCLALASEAGRARAASGRGAPHAVGTVSQVFAGGGGVPKAPLEQAVVGWRGIEGDRQRTRKHHGRVWQALSLWSLESIEGLADEGHPIAPGSTGENVVLVGVELGPLSPGTLLRLGGVVCEVSVPATPCTKIAACFSDRDLSRIHHERRPGWSRLYATVVRPGTVRRGDVAVVE